jgi:hypothetical protein
LSNFAWFAQIRNMSRGHFFGKWIFPWFFPHLKVWEKDLKPWRIFEYEGYKNSWKNWVFPPKTGKQFFLSKLVLTIRFCTLESVGKKLKIFENN